VSGDTIKGGPVRVARGVVPAKIQETRRKSRIDLDLYYVYGISEGASALQ
jgi:hypothetical protein